MACAVNAITGQMAEDRIGADVTQHLDAIHPRKGDVEQHDLRLLRRERGEPVRAVRVLRDRVGITEYRAEKQAVVDVVLDDHDPFHGTSGERKAFSSQAR